MVLWDDLRGAARVSRGKQWSEVDGKVSNNFEGPKAAMRG